MASKAVLFGLYLALVLGFDEAAGLKRKLRYLLYNPADMSTAIGYQNHHVSDMTSLVKEASTNAHAGSSSAASNSGPYNIQNFPAMSGAVAGRGGSKATGTGSTSTGSSSGSASFAGTNQWRCDSHVVDTCDTQCLDVDPKDGCPFCIPACTSKLSGPASSQSGSQSVTGQGTQGSQSGSLLQYPSSLSGGTAIGQSGGLSQLSSGLLGTGSQGNHGNPFSQTNSQPGGPSQLSSGLSGTGSQGNTGSPSSQTSSTGSSKCSYYPPNCPLVYSKMENGCLVCTILKQLPSTIGSKPTTTLAPTTQKSTVATCAPKRCVPPCDKGVVLGADGCPRCLCPTHV